jgi:hypothetical protein
MTQVIQTPEQQFNLAKLLGYSYEILYKSGAQNRVAGALSRLHENPSQCLVITVPHWDFIQHLRKSFTEDNGLIDLIQKIEASPDSYLGFRIIQGLLYFRDKLYSCRFTH